MRFSPRLLLPLLVLVASACTDTTSAVPDATPSDAAPADASPDAAVCCPIDYPSCSGHGGSLGGSLTGEYGCPLFGTDGASKKSRTVIDRNGCPVVQVLEIGSCGPTPETDAGAPDASSNDAEASVDSGEDAAL